MNLINYELHQIQDRRSGSGFQPERESGKKPLLHHKFLQPLVGEIPFTLHPNLP